MNDKYQVYEMLKKNITKQQDTMHITHEQYEALIKQLAETLGI